MLRVAPRSTSVGAIQLDKSILSTGCFTDAELGDPRSPEAYFPGGKAKAATIESELKAHGFTQDSPQNCTDAVFSGQGTSALVMVIDASTDEYLHGNLYKKVDQSFVAVIESSF